MSTASTRETCPGSVPATCPACGNDIPSLAQLIADARREVDGHGADPDALCCPGGTFGAGTWAAHVLAQLAVVDALRAELDELRACLDWSLDLVSDLRDACDHDFDDDGQMMIQRSRAALAKEPTRG